MNKVSKILVAHIEEGIDVTFVYGDFPTYGMIFFDWQTDEGVVAEVLSHEDHTKYLQTGTEDDDVANAISVRVIYEAK